MAKTDTLTPARQKALAGLSRRPGFVIEGGTRRMGIYVRDGDAVTQPHIALWLDPASGFVLATTMIAPEQSPDGGVSEALEALLAAIVPTAPSGRSSARGFGQPVAFGALLGQGPERSLPERVRVNDADLAAAVEAALGPFGVAVEYAAQLPAFEAVYQSFAQGMGADDDAEPPAPFDWDIDPTVIAPLFNAAARYARRKPWDILPDNPPLAVELGADRPEPGVETLYASILGAGEEVFGAAFYYSADGYRRSAANGAVIGPDEEDVDAALALLDAANLQLDTLSQGELHNIVADVTGTGMDEQQMRDAMEDCLVIFLEDEEESDPTYLDWLDDHDIKFASRQDIPSVMRTMRGGESRLPDAREVRALTLALEGLNGFISTHRARLAGATAPPDPLAHTTRVGTGRDRTPVTVTAPAPSFSWDDEYGDPVEPLE